MGNVEDTVGTFEGNDKESIENQENIEIEDAGLEPVKGMEIGIDLGTTNSVVSYVENGKIKTFQIKNTEIIPSAIFFESPDKILYGRIAMLKGLEYPQSVAKLFKRKLKDKKDKIQIEFGNQGDDETVSSEEGKTYIIDTNVFIDEPDILDRFKDGDKIVVSIKVIDELTYRKSQEETSYQAEEAINDIKRRENRLMFESSDSSLLPEDLDKRLNDNLILSIALKLTDENPILLTSDKDFQLKCEKYGINFQSLNDFLLDKPIASANKKDTIQITGEEASALFLRYLKNEVTKALGPVSNAVITVPANFNNVEVEATKRAGERAGFEEIIILKEPTAAAIAYGLEADENKKILVYDFGGGTFDVSIIEAQSDKTFTVMGTGGDSHLGGEDLTHELIQFIYEELEEGFDLDMASPENSGLTSAEYISNKKSVYKEAELAKIQLSELEETEVSFPIIYVETGVQKTWSLKITRNEFEDLVRDKVKKTLDALDKTLNDAGLLVTDIDIIVLAGGTSLMPIIQDRVTKYFGKSPNYEKNTATVISQGAAIVASSEWDKSEDGIQEKIEYYEKTVVDFGVSVKGRIFDCLIPVNTQLPVRVQKEYSPIKDNQENLRISAFRRDKNYPKARRTFDDGIDFIDEIQISNLPPMRQSEAVITVTFELTKEDILDVDVEVRNLSGTLIDSKGMRVEKTSRMK